MGGLDPPNQKQTARVLENWIGGSSPPMERNKRGSIDNDQSLNQLALFAGVFLGGFLKSFAETKGNLRAFACK